MKDFRIFIDFCRSLFDFSVETAALLPAAYPEKQTLRHHHLSLRHIAEHLEGVGAPGSFVTDISAELIRRVDLAAPVVESTIVRFGEYVTEPDELGYPADEGRSLDTQLSLFDQSREPLDRLKVVTVRNVATHAGRSVSAEELNGLCEVLFGGRALEGMIGLVGG